MALIIDPGRDPASAKSVKPEIMGHSLAPIRSYPAASKHLITTSLNGICYMMQAAARRLPT
jgi:hypothetical protein